MPDTRTSPSTCSTTPCEEDVALLLTMCSTRAVPGTRVASLSKQDLVDASPNKDPCSARLVTTTMADLDRLLRCASFTEF